MSRRVNKTGRHRSEKTTKELQLFRHVPHLAFIEPDRYDRIIGMLKERNAKYRRNGGGNGDPRRNVPRKRTRFPGQMLFCGICGRKFVFGGHGRTTPLMCNGAPEHRCWNGSTIDGPLAVAPRRARGGPAAEGGTNSTAGTSDGRESVMIYRRLGRPAGRPKASFFSYPGPETKHANPSSRESLRILNPRIAAALSLCRRNNLRRICGRGAFDLDADGSSQTADSKTVNATSSGDLISRTSLRDGRFVGHPPIYRKARQTTKRTFFGIRSRCGSAHPPI